ncbi:DDRGK domain-containing protein 1-like isoform X2 [Daphnia pulicaria]|uniref:DDRGK domain-containing protein 1-like isoform X2 n=1 Tax=Daphnia pulicaria TaxID=35523 RepID=UPI001EEC3865|nr:DDRGK domain-containing protein 1-like isoform X2 [Daphnia pulicaria]
MDNTIALAAAAVVLVLIIILLNFLSKQFGSKTEVQEPEAQQEVAAVGGVRRAVAARNRLGLRNRGGQRQQQDEPRFAGNQDSAGEDSEDEVASSLLDLGDMKVGKKKLAKLEAKAERKAAREAEEREREEKKALDLEKEKERKKIEELEEQAEKEKEEQIKREAEEKIRREHEEYLKMKAAFTVEEQGFDAQEESAEENLLQKFIDYVQETKIVLLEELAAHFQLKTEDAIDRLKKLVQEGSLTGVIDDRGKFIYISLEEMEAVAKFIRQRGRVSLSDLAESSNQLIQIGSKIQPAQAQAESH